MHLPALVLACLRTAAVFGVDACPVHVEVDVSFGFPSFTMVGLPDVSVRESRDRVRSAIRNSGFEFPAHRITVNLAPGDVRKAGPSFYLPIALGILAAQGIVERRTTVPILGHVLIEPNGNGLSLSATDLEVGIRTQVACSGKEKSLTLNARKLFQKKG